MLFVFFVVKSWSSGAFQRQGAKTPRLFFYLFVLFVFFVVKPGAQAHFNAKALRRQDAKTLFFYLFVLFVLFVVKSWARGLSVRAKGQSGQAKPLFFYLFVLFVVRSRALSSTQPTGAKLQSCRAADSVLTQPLEWRN